MLFMLTCSVCEMCMCLAWGGVGVSIMRRDIPRAGLYVRDYGTLISYFKH